MPSSPAHSFSSYFTLLKNNPNYRALWTGEVISLFGDWFNLIASAALVAKLTESGLAVGSLFVVRMLAPFFVSPLAGVVADRYNRRRILILADLARCFIVLGFLFVRTPGQVWLLYGLTALQLAFSGFFYPARNAMLPDIVSRAHIGSANALSSATWSVMLALGAAMGGAVTGGIGIYPSFVVDALSFLLSAVFILRIRYTPPAGLADSGRSIKAINEQYIQGIRYLLHRPVVLAIALQKGIVALVVNGAMQILMVAIAERVFVIGSGGSTGLGLFYAASGVGTGVGPILARRLTGDDPRLLRRWLVFSYVLLALGSALTAMLGSFWLVTLGTFVRAIGGGISWVFSTTLLLQLAPEHVRGRVFSTEFAIFTLGSAVGTAAAGWLFDSSGLGISGLAWLLAGMTLLAGTLSAAWTFRSEAEPSVAD